MVEELKVTLLLKRAVHHLDIQQFLGHWLHRAQLLDEDFKRTHYDTAFKHYVFSSPFPTEKDGVYQQGRVYVLTIRSSVRDILNRMKKCLQQAPEDEYFQYIASEQRAKRWPHITELLAITPVIVTVDGKPWLHENSMELLLQQLHGNAEKKLKHLEPSGEWQAQQPFIQGIRVENRKPVALGYKGRKLLGNKLRLTIHDDPVSQRLARVVLGSGLGEKVSTVGAGFCLAK